ncbi:elongation factor 1, putative [Eimeria acervulina]|uniref:Elongation factor 1, putative n=1 Tax=Eimeria acervulina TaxID=5801 RepID=U6G9I5_EIMAC|nr:elongation factor 1, putative [Eimeria acervulina]CDI76795.1 elongation factor 1, putative [Eimeria acervulina]
MMIDAPACCELSVACRYYVYSLDGNKQKQVQEEEDIDLFGDDDDGEELKKLAAKKKDEEKQKKKKAEVVNKSMLVIEVKPNSSETNLDEIAVEIKKINMNGVSWGENIKKVPIAFGLYKLQVQCVILDDLVDTQEVLDRIEEIGMNEEDKQKREEILQRGEDDQDYEELSGLVQSAQIVSFNKL